MNPCAGRRYTPIPAAQSRVGYLSVILEHESVAQFCDAVLSFMANHSVNSELTAVQDGRISRGGYRRQGPIHDLFLTERGAK